MAYFAPYIDATGIHIPSYQDVLADLIAQAKNIYGQNMYLGVDSQDYQFISTFAAKTNDTNQLLQAVYNSFGPAGATGTALDSRVKLNGLKRLSSTYSTCIVTLTGTANTVINNGVVQDIAGNIWSLPSPITIGTGGTVNATVTCQIAGPITVNLGDISKIVTPTYGWTSVTNAAATDTVGIAAETDSKLKGRQSISTAQPSKTLLEGTRGAIAGVAGVTRWMVYNNDQAATAGTETSGPSPSTNISAGPANQLQIAVDADVVSGAYRNIALTLTGLTTGAAIAAQLQTQIRAQAGIYAAVTVAYANSLYVITSGTTGISSMVAINPAVSSDVSAALKLGIANGATDTNGWPGHSITCVVENGDQTAIATAIWKNKGPGCGTNGTTQVVLTDSYGQVTPINFYRPTYVDIDVVVNVHRLPGYTTASTTAIQNSIVNYLNSLVIGQNSLNSSLWGSALSVQSINQPTFSITSLTCAQHGGTQGIAPVPILFNQVARGNVAYITINFV